MHFLNRPSNIWANKIETANLTQRYAVFTGFGHYNVSTKLSIPFVLCIGEFYLDSHKESTMALLKSHNFKDGKINLASPNSEKQQIEFKNETIPME